MSKRVSTAPYSLWEVWIDDRLVAIYSDRGYGHYWKYGLSTYKTFNNLSQLKWGVNIMVYALIHRGGIAKRYVNYDNP